MKPEPKPTKIVCSLCGLDWDKHDAKPTAEKCVKLLKAEMAKRPAFHPAISGTGYTVPYIGNTAVN